MRLLILLYLCKMPEHSYVPANKKFNEVMFLKDNKIFDEKYNIPSHHLLSSPLRIPVEQLVSNYLGREWQVKAAEDKTDFASHICAVLSDGCNDVFVKLSEDILLQDQFELEIASLRLLKERSKVLTPPIIGIITIEGCSIMVLEAVQEVDRESRHWRQIGQTLAQIHQAKWDQCGLEINNYFGPLLQDNTPVSDWPTFYVERRLLPRLKIAVDTGKLPLCEVRKVEKLITRVPQLCGPSVQPSLLHGDAQQNNFISTKMGAVIIDAPIYYGNPELDLAFIEYFQPVPEDVFSGYQDIMSIDPGFWGRRDLWRISGWLACVIVDGDAYLDKLISAVQKYL